VWTQVLRGANGTGLVSKRFERCACFPLSPIHVGVKGVWGRSHHNEACRVQSVTDYDLKWSGERGMFWRVMEVRRMYECR
jgi:hypothetical protein